MDKGMSKIVWGEVGSNQYFCFKCKQPILNYRERVRLEVTVYSGAKKNQGSVNSLKDFHLGCTSIDRFNYQQVGSG